MPRLGVNIDHIATLREIRQGIEPEPLFAALIAEAAGADGIVVHLREDRRHIKEKDVYFLRQAVRTQLNLEMSVSADIARIACEIKPDRATLVPERRRELTTEGGLDVVANPLKISRTIKKLQSCGIEVSLFIDPDSRQIEAAKKSGAKMIELHTGRYANAKTERESEKYLGQIKRSAIYAHRLGFSVFAGHGLNYYNVSPIVKIRQIEELNIGYSIVCRASLVGLQCAVKEMKQLIT